MYFFFFFFQAEDGIRDRTVTGVQTCALPIFGPQTGRELEPYSFSQPPTVHVSGYAPLKGSSDADLHFAVEGGSFAWLKFKVPHLAGDVHWLGDTMILTNVQSEFYWGNLAGHADFAFNRDQPGTDFRYDATVTNVHLSLLMPD